MSLTHDKERRDALADARRRVRELERPDREARKIAEAQRRAAREVGRSRRVSHQRTKPKGGHEADPAFMAWQHESRLVCVACEILGAPTAAELQGEPNPIEVAHQRVDGWKAGRKAHDRHSCPLCRWHHQLAPNACDKGQRKFWAVLEIDPADYCAALHQAYRANSDGSAVQLRFIPRRSA